MKKYMFFLLSAMLLFGGCAKESEPIQETVVQVTEKEKSKADLLKKDEETSAAVQESNAEELEEVQEEIVLTWTSLREGTYPMDCTLETIQFSGSDDIKLSAANEDMRIGSDNQWQRYSHCTDQGFEACMENAETWGDIWAYPVSNERYLNAVSVWREKMYFRIGEEFTWNTVSSYVYDKEKKQFVFLEDALTYAQTQTEQIEQDIADFIFNTGDGEYDGLSSMAYVMLEDGTPMFIVGALIDSPDAPVWGPVFFTWTDGYVECTDDHPLPLHLLDTAQDLLACQESMSQFYENEIPLIKDSMALLSEIVEVQEYLAQGMSMRAQGTVELINMQQCIGIALGNEKEGQFVKEIHYAVSEDTVYRMNEESGEWETVAFG